MPGMIQPERKIVWDVTGTLAQVTVKSFFSKRDHTRTLNMTKAQFELWQSGEYIQRALPHLSPDEREFLLTGATPEEWDVEFHTEGDADYRGVVSPGETDWRVYIEDEEGSKPLPIRLDLANHSPDGFAWGYGGSGPAQLALALLADAVGDDVALKFYQRFKSEVVAAWPMNGVWTYSRAEAREWVKSRLDIESR
jgi:hypothetical protein